MNTPGTPIQPPAAQNPHPGFRQLGRSAAAALLIALPVLAAGFGLMSADAADRAENGDPLKSLLSRPAGAAIAPASFARGKEVFFGTCAACHGADGLGKPNLGKDIVHSGFVAMLDDERLTDFLRTGRAANDPLNTTRIPMPPMGGNATLTKDDLRDVTSYLRAVQDARRAPSADALAALPKPAGDAPAGDEWTEEEWLTLGKTKFAMTCVACHGADGRGIKGGGKDLTTSAFVRAQSEEQLTAFIIRGRDPSDPANTTKIQMPPRGGNPALTDEQAEAIATYVLSLQQSATTASK
jgi:disulfide bond formation protein DsbB